MNTFRLIYLSDTPWSEQRFETWRSNCLSRRSSDYEDRAISYGQRRCFGEPVRRRGGHANGSKGRLKRARVAAKGGPTAKRASPAIWRCAIRPAMRPESGDGVAGGHKHAQPEWANEEAASKSAASRHWIAATAGKIAGLREREVRSGKFIGLMIEGIALRAHAMVVVALGIKREGHKVVLDFEPGASRKHDGGQGLGCALDGEGLRHARRASAPCGALRLRAALLGRAGNLARGVDPALGGLRRGLRLEQAAVGGTTWPLARPSGPPQRCGRSQCGRGARGAHHPAPAQPADAPQPLAALDQRHRDRPSRRLFTAMLRSFGTCDRYHRQP